MMAADSRDSTTLRNTVKVTSIRCGPDFPAAKNRTAQRNCERQTASIKGWV